MPETLAAYRKAVELKPKMAEARFNLGLVLFDTGKRDEALAEYEAQRKLDGKLAGRFKEFVTAPPAKARRLPKARSPRRDTLRFGGLAQAEGCLARRCGRARVQDRMSRNAHVDSNL